MSTQSNYDLNKTSYAAETFKTLLGAAASAGAAYGLLKYAENIVKVFVVGSYQLNPTLAVAGAGYAVAKVVELAVSKLTGNEAIGSIFGVVAQGGIYAGLVLKYPVLPFVLSASPVAPVAVAIVFIAFKFFGMSAKINGMMKQIAEFPKLVENAKNSVILGYKSELEIENLKGKNIAEKEWEEKLNQKENTIQKSINDLNEKTQEIKKLKLLLLQNEKQSNRTDELIKLVGLDKLELGNQIQKLENDVNIQKGNIEKLTNEKNELTEAKNKFEKQAGEKQKELETVQKSLNEKTLEANQKEEEIKKITILLEIEKNEKLKGDEKYNKLNQQHIQLTNEKETLENEKQELTKQKQTLENEKQKLTLAKENAEKTVLQKQQLIEEQVTLIQKAEEDVQNKNNAFNELNQKYNELLELYKKLRENSEQLVKDKEELTNKYNLLNIEKENLEKDILKIKEEHKNALLEKNQIIENKNQEIEQKEILLNDLKQKNEKLKSDLEEQKENDNKLINEVKEQLENFGIGYNNLEEKHKKFVNENQIMVQDYENQLLDLKQKLEKKEKELKENEEKVINPFQAENN